MAAPRKTGLGRGLDAIFGEGVENVLEDIQAGKTEHVSSKTELPVSEIRANPYQPRKVFDDEKLKELASSIKEHGVFTPILVRKSLHGYELIAGERRLRASKLAGKETIPAITMEFNDEQMMEIALLENIQREDLNIMEEASAYSKLMERMGYTQERLAERVGKSRVHIANTIRLLKLPVSVQKLVEENRLSQGHVRPLITLDDEGLAYDIAMRIVDEGLSVRAVEKLVRDAKEPKPAKKEKVKDHNLIYVEEIMQKKLQTKVKVEGKSITISYQDTKDLNRILELIGCIEED